MFGKKLIKSEVNAPFFFREGEGAGQGFINGILAKLHDATN